ncbi:C-type lectin 37Db-like [Drosophila ficusphila]|uniref:C-type lectin 37Db-like n=1 Tax=Drosophila ficusphila TaxID=30025 RepID=UPI001C89F3BE|nr:C-type lectin 37Db-like [Drosophila ficusphila]
MLSLAIYFLCSLIAFGVYGSPPDPKNCGGFVCVLNDPPNQCGQFCLAALRPLIDHIAMQKEWNTNDAFKLNKTQVKLENIEKQQETLNNLVSQDIEARLQKMENQLQELLTKVTTAPLPLKAVVLPGFEKIGKRYFYVERTHQMNWFAAQKTCIQMGGQLAVIQDEQELEALRSRITHDTKYWLGINDLVNEGEYVSWTTGKRVPFLKWRPGEPNHARKGENCVNLFIGAMYDNGCDIRYYFICQAAEGN